MDYEWGKSIEKGNSITDLNLSISTRQVGFGFNFILRDFSYCIDIHLLFIHFVLIKYYGGIV